MKNLNTGTGAPPRGATDWCKDAVIYQVNVRTFADGNGDGVGDLVGLRSRLDYVEKLGCNTIWLLPIQDSPLRDGGYDVRDYMKVLPEYGTLEDLDAFLDEAHARGIRVIIDFVVNHTSDQHPWFQAARRDPGSRFRSYYVWTADPGSTYPGTRVIFCDTHSSNWTWDEQAGAFYWHRFFDHQPDLNYDNPEVQDAVLGIASWWAARGVDGFRLDAVPYLFEREGTNNESLPETHAFLKKLRAHLGDGVLLLGEANQPPAIVRDYFGDGDELQMNYHFPLMPRLFLALADGRAGAIESALRDTPDIPPSCQWALFLRNHDELSLEMMDDERQRMVAAYAPDPRMMMNVGIRRRLAPLLDGDARKIKLMNAMLLSLPGSPIVYAGDEIGMGDNIELPDRDGVRTPMQWSTAPNAGFSTVADPSRLPFPIIMRDGYGPDVASVEVHERNPHSLLAWMRHAIAVRRQHPVFGRGSFALLPAANEALFAFERADAGERIVCVHNVSATTQQGRVIVRDAAGRATTSLLGGGRSAIQIDGTLSVALGPYEALWLQLDGDAGGSS